MVSTARQKLLGTHIKEADMGRASSRCGREEVVGEPE
jgi:hypothetical protein